MPPLFRFPIALYTGENRLGNSPLAVGVCVVYASQVAGRTSRALQNLGAKQLVWREIEQRSTPYY